MLDFKDYMKLHREGYCAPSVEKNFYKVQSILGPTDKNDTLVSITIRLKGKADWITANNVANGYEFRLVESSGEGVVDTGNYLGVCY